MTEVSAQDRYGPNGVCFGCGPKNPKGLQIKSRWEGDDFILRYKPKEEHRAFGDILNGGIIGSLFDCHSNWCAATTLFKLHPDKPFPSTVTSEFYVKLKRPTPLNAQILIKAKPSEIDGTKVIVEAEMWANNKLTATCRGIFFAVQPGHPAFHRWD